ncbi:MAG: (4Fe-4S)-binding protein [Firmicutes bacterium]|nr:(4Fe-4S)-binding protein [Bacillota bacterium]
MKYRKLPRGEEQISVIGMGSSVVGEQTEKDIIENVEFALNAGINYFDLAAGHASVFPAYGRALEGCRKEAMLQVHFGANYTKGEYGWTTDLNAVKKSIDWQLQKLKTDYIDFGFIHCLDEAADLAAYEKNGVLDFLLSMKAQGVVKHIGLSTHAPEIASKVLDKQILDMIMFSINPMYDYGQGDYAIGTDGERQKLYRRCEKEGVAISVMKPFNAGQLLDAKRSPFHQALTTAQCIQYALDKPGVVTVLGGPADIPQLKEILTYFDSSEEERDYSIISTLTPDESMGNCVYCRHCHPCPAGLDIGLINKYYDLALQGDTLAKEHYLTLDKTASDCISCGHCNSRCPFKVQQMQRMDEIRNYFGK